MRNIDGPGVTVEALPAGAALFYGRVFEDERGSSWETLNAADLSGVSCGMMVAQENIVHTRKMGTLRGLHYQVDPCGQAKLVSVVQGAAQFFWLDLLAGHVRAAVKSVNLQPGEGSLWTPEWCAHGFLALADDTIFTLKMSRPIHLAKRAELSFFADDIDVEFACAPNLDLLSDRDAAARSFSDRRPFRPL